MKTYLLNPRSIEGSVEEERTNERVTIEIAKLGCLIIEFSNPSFIV